MKKSTSSHSSYGSLDFSDTPTPTETMEISDDLDAAMLATAAAESVAKHDNVAASFGSDDFAKIRKEAGAAAAGEDTTSASPQSPAKAQTEHLVKSRQYYRDMVLGVNDGLVSTFLLVAGVVGGGMNVEATLLTSISGAIAGAISMFAGEYVATKSQNEVMKGEIKLEHEHIAKYHQEEMKELSNLFSLIGIPGSSPHLCHAKVGESTAHSSNVTSSAKEARKLRQRMTEYYGSNPDALLKIMIALEFGVIDGETRNPLVAGGSSLALFFVGSLPSVIPFVCVTDSITGLIASGIATAIGLFLVGAVKTWATRGNLWLAAMENLLITAAGGGVAYGIGVGFQNLMSDEG